MDFNNDDSDEENSTDETKRGQSTDNNETLPQASNFTVKIKVKNSFSLYTAVHIFFRTVAKILRMLI